jgi:hypothetical protein
VGVGVFGTVDEWGLGKVYYGPLEKDAATYVFRPGFDQVLDRQSYTMQAVQPWAGKLEMVNDKRVIYPT